MSEGDDERNRAPAAEAGPCSWCEGDGRLWNPDPYPPRDGRRWQMRTRCPHCGGSGREPPVQPGD